MAQQDKGLVTRGLLLLAGIGLLVTSVLAMLFWRPQAQPAALEPLTVQDIPAVALPPLGPFPAGVSWYAIHQLGQTLPSGPGRDIRYNAATALARRGSAAVPWPLIREMMDERQQMRNNRVRLENGRDVHDEASARTTMVSALRAVAVWHEKQPADKKQVSPELREVYRMVDKLTESPIDELKVQALKARNTFFR